MTARTQLSCRRCFAIGCDLLVPLNQVMCESHWARVPSRLRVEVLDAMRSWENGGPLQPYNLATLEARLHLARIENRPEAPAIHEEIVKARGQHQPLEARHAS